MPDEVSIPDRRSLTRLFPALRLVGAIRQAFDLRKLIIAALGLALLQPGWSLLDRLVPPAADTTPDLFGARPSRSRAYPRPTSGLGRPSRGFIPGSQSRSGCWRLRLFAFVEPGSRMGADAACDLERDLADRRLGNLWGRDLPDRDRASRRDAANQAHRRPAIRAGQCRAAHHGPALPVARRGVFRLDRRGHSGFSTGAVRSGRQLAGIGLSFPLAAGLVMTLLVAGLAAGWPLLQAATAGGAEDALDALSRVFGYLNQRLGSYAALVALAWLVGMLGLALVDLLTGRRDPPDALEPVGLTAPIAATESFFGSPEHVVIAQSPARRTPSGWAWCACSPTAGSSAFSGRPRRISTCGCGTTSTARPGPKSSHARLSGDHRAIMPIT